MPADGTALPAERVNGMLVEARHTVGQVKMGRGGAVNMLLMAAKASMMTRRVQNRAQAALA